MNKRTLLLVAHGSSEFKGDNPVIQLAETLSKRNLFDNIIHAFLHQQPLLKDVLSQIQTQELCVIPMFSGYGYITSELIPKALDQVSSEIRVRIFDPIGTHSEIPNILAKQALSIIEKNSLKPKEVSVLIVGHGHTKNSKNANQTIMLARSVQKVIHGANVDTAFIEEPPLISNWAQNTTTKYLIVLPYLVGGGLHTQEDIPIMLGLVSGNYSKEPFSGPHYIQGHTIWYCRPYGFDGSLADIILKIVSK